MPASWTIFSNSIIIFLFIPLSLLIFNIAKRNIKLPHALLGYKMSIKTARGKFVWPLEKIVDGKRKFAYMPKEFDADEEFDKFEKNGISEIWITPKVPFMIPLLVGFICSFIFGDILYYLMGVIR
jgi:preflagellin peptidase FlaK